MSSLIPPDVPPADGAVPFSARYGDVYHAAAGALQQAHHVFLRGNGLPERWRGRTQFTVCETGFGLGLNFLALWQAWRTDPQRAQRLHVVSLEAHPFDVEALAQWHARLVPEALQPLALALREQWPLALPGLHRLEFDQGAVTLTLGWGDAAQLVPELTLAVDAYFLDGFAPARNPTMWSPDLFVSLASHAAPGATLATWTSAGAVRRGLAAAGFEVGKVPGFAGKREMTVGRWPRPTPGPAAGVLAPAPVGRLAVVGAGLAGVGVAAAFARRGWQVTLVAPARPVTPTGGGHVAAALTPVAEPHDTLRTRLVRAGALHALRSWAARFDLSDPDGPVSAVGTFQVLNRRLAQRPAAADDWLAGLAALAWPTAWLQPMTAAEAAARVGQAVAREGVFYPQALRVRLDRLLAAWSSFPGIRHQVGWVARLAPVVGGGWRLHDGAGGVLAVADKVVLAAAGQVPALLATAQGLAPAAAALGSLSHVAGQISLVDAADLAHGGPRTIVAGDGYVLPAVAGACVVGSTYDHQTPWGGPATPSDEGHAHNLMRLRGLLPEADPHGRVVARRGWAGWRAVLPDRLPAVAWCTSDLAVATAFGSRGLAWAALAGEVLAQACTAEPLSLERSGLAAMAPSRVHKSR